MANEKTFQVGIKGVITQDAKVLILRSFYESSGKEYWDLPGGRMHVEDSSIENTLIREVTEELPQVENIQINKLLRAFRMPSDFPDGVGLFICTYQINAKLPNPILLSDEHTEYRWVTKEEAEELYESKKILFRDGLYESVLLAF